MSSKSLRGCLLLLALAPACGSSKGKGVDAASPRDGWTDGTDGAAAGDADARALDAADGGADLSPSVPEGGAGDGATDGANTPDGATDKGDADAQPLSGSPLRVLQVAVGLTDTCVLLDNHRVKCWGSNGFGALGLGDALPRGAAADMGDALPFVDLGTGRTATAISAGRYHACAILDNGSVKCWGFRVMTGLPPNAGQSGVGDEPGEMGDALPALELGAGRKATHIGCGYVTSCAVLDDGSAKCWGSDPVASVPAAATLGSTSKVRQLAQGSLGIFALFEDGTMSPLVPANRPSIPLGANEKAVYLAGTMSSLCAVLESGAVKCRDQDWAAQPSQAYQAFALTGTGLSCGLSKAGAVLCLGAGSCTSTPTNTKYWCDGAATPPNGMAGVALGQKAVALGSGGLEHTCAILADGSLKCWTTIDTCPNGQGGSMGCAVPLTPNLLLGGSVDIVGTGATRTFGPWRTVDLGKHP